MEQINWEKEVKDLKQVGESVDRNWWKTTVGAHRVKFMENGEEYSTFWDDKEIPKVRFEVEVDANPLSWGVTKGITENSLYGQIALVGKDKGSLIGVEITVVVKGTGKETSYTVLEALPLMTQKIVEKEEVVE